MYLGCVDGAVCVVRVRASCGEGFWLLLVLCAVVATWLRDGLLLVVVGQLSLWDWGCFEAVVWPGGAC